MRANLAFAFFSCLLFIASCKSKPGKELELTLPPEPNMPAFTNAFDKKANDFYNLRFTKDTFPAKITDDGLFENPIYGIYVIKDYYRQYFKNDSSKEYLNAIKAVANSAIRRMDNKDSSLVFWYPAGDYVSRAYKKHYSALTQSYYAIWFWHIYELTQDSTFRVASKKSFNSLLTPVEKGGVLFSWGENHISLEEFPDQPNSFILNGWLSTLMSVYEYATLSSDSLALKLFNQSCNSLASILHLFDAEKYKNSCYNLTGYLHSKLRFNLPGSKTQPKVIIKKAWLEVPGERKYSIPVLNPKTASRWQNYIYNTYVMPANNGAVQPEWQDVRMNLVLTKFSYPKQNRIVFEIEAMEDVDLTLLLKTGEYNPLNSTQVNTEYEEVTTSSISKGAKKCVLTIPKEQLELVAYPTNFIKKINGRQQNVYHFVHILKLQSLYELTRIEKFREYAIKWYDYTKQWPNMELYEGCAHDYHSKDIGHLLEKLR